MSDLINIPKIAKGVSEALRSLLKAAGIESIPGETPEDNKNTSPVKGGRPRLNDTNRLKMTLYGMAQQKKHNTIDYDAAYDAGYYPKFSESRNGATVMYRRDKRRVMDKIIELDLINIPRQQAIDLVMKTFYFDEVDAAFYISMVRGEIEGDVIGYKPSEDDILE